MKQTSEGLKIGDVVENIYSGQRMTIIYISENHGAFHNIYHCAWFTVKDSLQIDLFSEHQLQCIVSLLQTTHTENQVEINAKFPLKSKVLLNHQSYSESPTIVVLETVTNEGIAHAICKWITSEGNTGVDIFPLAALKNIVNTDKNDDNTLIDPLIKIST
ncbi:DUF2158 domain-containing protein [Xanthocytophaga flava]|uniref:DUF2158 domain-containing protein n=1 Tax=Xanthocytophaga flava TaxID=3048013 RepID=UPI0028D29C0C|nr:DUF2158 domain-containing protein [Xanthocytophaga flavus]MDJ1470328.1 DUF2158 domain-containing protein [Xanthocytophaga flavus]